MLKVNNKNNKTTSIMSFWCFYCQLGTYFTSFSSVCIAGFKKVNVSRILKKIWEKNQLSLALQTLGTIFKPISGQFAILTPLKTPKNQVFWWFQGV